MSRSTLKDGMYLSLSMSGCTCLLQVSPRDTRCTGLPILAWSCLAPEERYFWRRGSEPRVVLRTCMQEEAPRAEHQPAAARCGTATPLEYLSATAPPSFSAGTRLAMPAVIAP